MRTQDILDHLEKLMVLRAVSESGSIRAASEILNVAQPSLSTKIKNLEEVLEVQLLTRSKKGVRLTEAGHKVLRFAQEIEKSAQSLKFDLQRGEEVFEGHINIGIYDSIACYMWADFYREFSREFPQISIGIKTGRSSDLLRLLAVREIDMAITIEPHLGREYFVETAFQDHFSCFASRDFVEQQLEQDAELPVVELAESLPRQVSLILFSRALAEDGKQLDLALRLKRPEQFLFHDVENFEVSLRLCRDGIGLAILPNRVAKKAVESGELVKVKLDSNMRTEFSPHNTGISILKSQQSQPIIQRVLAELRKFSS